MKLKVILFFVGVVITFTSRVFGDSLSILSKDEQAYREEMNPQSNNDEQKKESAPDDIMLDTQKQLNQLGSNLLALRKEIETLRREFDYRKFDWTDQDRITDLEDFYSDIVGLLQNAVSHLSKTKNAKSYNNFLKGVDTLRGFMEEEIIILKGYFDKKETEFNADEVARLAEIEAEQKRVRDSLYQFGVPVGGYTEEELAQMNNQTQEQQQQSDQENQSQEQQQQSDQENQSQEQQQQSDQGNQSQEQQQQSDQGNQSQEQQQQSDQGNQSQEQQQQSDQGNQSQEQRQLNEMLEGNQSY